ncbi:hypothetical protein DFH08DRAFT_820747 [Mycena albidolilacea]|uniref:Uncharacterized protein n=1 Tax=Mycena albidolilacea TaxID=1033008 RepID=A0AAD7EES7_9AGAR|nr:hypothetical protein DFH08DRAFT_820747 [Mycena albidolilacea]
MKWDIAATESPEVSPPLPPVRIPPRTPPTLFHGNRDPLPTRGFRSTLKRTRDEDGEGEVGAHARLNSGTTGGMEGDDGTTRREHETPCARPSMGRSQNAVDHKWASAITVVERELGEQELGADEALSGQNAGDDVPIACARRPCSHWRAHYYVLPPLHRWTYSSYNVGDEARSWMSPSEGRSRMWSSEERRGHCRCIVAHGPPGNTTAKQRNVPPSLGQEWRTHDVWTCLAVFGFRVSQREWAACIPSRIWRGWTGGECPARGVDAAAGWSRRDSARVEGATAVRGRDGSGARSGRSGEAGQSGYGSARDGCAVDASGTGGVGRAQWWNWVARAKYGKRARRGRPSAGGGRAAREAVGVGWDGTGRAAKGKSVSWDRTGRVHGVEAAARRDGTGVAARMGAGAHRRGSGLRCWGTRRRYRPVLKLGGARRRRCGCRKQDA